MDSFIELLGWSLLGFTLVMLCLAWYGVRHPDKVTFSFRVTFSFNAVLVLVLCILIKAYC